MPNNQQIIKNLMKFLYEHIFSCKHGKHITKENCDECYKEYLLKLKEKYKE